MGSRTRFWRSRTTLVGSPTGDGLDIADPDFDLRYDESFPLVKLVARPPSGTIDPGFWLLVPGSLGFMGFTQLLGAHSTAVFTATLISMMSLSVCRPGCCCGALRFS
jgi:hypothetical protein